MHGIGELKVCNWTWIDSNRTGMTEMLTGHETRTLDIAVDTSTRMQSNAGMLQARHGYMNKAAAKQKMIWMDSRPYKQMSRAAQPHTQTDRSSMHMQKMDHAYAKDG